MDKDKELTASLADVNQSKQGSLSMAKIKVESNAEITKSKEKIKGIQYSISSMNGLQFVERKGERVSPADIEDLKKETVVFLEFEHNEAGKDLLDLDALKMNKDDAIKYLSGAIASDISIENGDSPIVPNGIMYEGTSSGSKKVRVILFFSGCENQKEIEIQYNDRLFGAGLIKLITKD